MGNFIPVGKASELKDGTMKTVTIQGQEILLAKVAGKCYAASSRCPHLGGKLAQGKLEGKIVTCPLHGSQFDLSDGRVIRWLKGSGLLSTMGKVLKSPKSLATYNVKVEDDNILLEI